MDNGMNLEELLLDDSVNETVQEPDTIRPNSPTLLIDETTSRFSSAIWMNKINITEVTLAGIGGIGSWTALLLSRIRPKWIYIYDSDRVEAGNMSGQLFGTSDINMGKASSIHKIIRNFCGYCHIYAYDNNYDTTKLRTPVMICGFDNMAARKMYYQCWKEGLAEYEDASEALFIDGRLAAEEFQIFCIKGDDTYSQKIYEDKWLFPDEEAEETVCSYKQTSHCACMIASVIVNLLVNFIANQCEPLIERDVPFLTSYNAETMYFKTES